MTRSGAETGTRLELGEFKSDLVPESVPYTVLLPDRKADVLPMVYILHGGGGSRDFLDQARPWVEAAWADDSLPPCVVVTPTATARCFYMNYKDGSERWEDLIVGPLRRHICDTFGASSKREDTVAMGPSMGGMGALRMGFKHPDIFAVVAGLEPGIEPALRFADIELQDRFWRDSKLFERAYGDPVDDDYWQANNPASIASVNAERLRSSGLAVYLECGDEDSFGLHRGSEFLHRVLYDRGIAHEYRLVRGADHVGRTLPARFADAFAFIGRSLDPPGPDDGLEGLHKMIDRLRNRAGLPPRGTPSALPSGETSQ